MFTRNSAQILVLFVMWTVAGCGTGSKPPANSAGEMYPSRELGRFVSETGESRIADQYYIQVGDRLDVVFFFHQDLTTQGLLVRSDGRITLPYVGDQMAVGYTPMQLDSLLSMKFSEVLRDPNLSVIVTESRSRIVYVLGEVVRPGSFEFNESMSIVQALSSAGGLEPTAKEEYTLILRREGLDRVVGVRVNVKDILKGEGIQQDIALRHDDVLFVPKTALGAAADVMKLIDEIVGPPINYTLRALQIRSLSLHLE